MARKGDLQKQAERAGKRKGQLRDISAFRKQQLLIRAGLTPEQAKQVVPFKKTGLEIAGDIAKEIALFVPEAIVRTGLTATQLPLTAFETAKFFTDTPGERAAFERRGPTIPSLDLPGLRRQESPFAKAIRQTGEAASTGDILKSTAAATGQTAFDVAFGLLPATRAINTLGGIPGLQSIGPTSPAGGPLKGIAKAGDLLGRPIPTVSVGGIGGAIGRAKAGQPLRAPVSPPSLREAAGGAIAAGGAAAQPVAGVAAKPGRRFRDIFRRTGIADDVADDIVAVTKGRPFGQVKDQLSKTSQRAFKAAGVTDETIVTAQQAATVLSATRPKSPEAARGAATQVTKLLDNLTSSIDDIRTPFTAGARAIGRSQADELAEVTLQKSVFEDVLGVLARSQGALRPLSSQERISTVAEALSVGVKSQLQKLGDLASQQTTGIAAKQARNVEAQLEAFLRQPGVSQTLTEALFEPNPGISFIKSGRDIAGIVSRVGQAQRGALPQELQEATKQSLREAGLGRLSTEVGKPTKTQLGLVRKFQAAGAFGDDAAFQKRVDAVTGSTDVKISQLNASEAMRLLREANISKPQTTAKLRRQANETLLFVSPEELSGGVPTPAGPGQVEMGQVVKGVTAQAVLPYQLVVGKMGEGGKKIVSTMRNAINSRDRMNGKFTAAIMRATGGAKLSASQIDDYINVVRHGGKSSDEAVKKLVKELDKEYRRAGRLLEKLKVPVLNPRTGTYAQFQMRKDFGMPRYPDRIKIGAMTREEIVQKIVENNKGMNRAEAQFIANKFHAEYASNPSGSVVNSRIYGKVPDELLMNDPYEVALLYAKKTGQTIGIVEQFGAKAIGGAKGRAQIIHPGYEDALKLIPDGDRNYVATGWNRMIGKDVQATHFDELLAGTLPGTGIGAKIVRGIGGVRGWQAMSKLGVNTTFTNLGGNNNTIMAGSLKAFLKGTQEGARAHGKAYAKAQLGLLDDVANYMADYGGSTAIAPKKLLEWQGFSPVERGNRIAAFFAGRHHMVDDVIPQIKAGNPRGRSWLRDFVFMGDGAATDDFIKVLRKNSFKMTNDQLDDVGRGFTTSTQFKPDVLSLPLWATSKWGRVLFQFKTFMFRHTALLGKIYRNAAKDSAQLAKAGRLPEAAGAISPVVRHLGGSVLIGELVGDLRALASGAPRDPDIPFLDDDKNQLLSRLIDNMLWVGGIGIAHDVFTASTNRKFAQWLAGPTVTDAIEIIQTAAQTAESGNFEPVARRALREIPAAGRLVQPRLLPTQRQERAQREQGTDITGLLGL